MKHTSLFISGLALSFLLSSSPQASSQYALLAKQITLNGYEFFADSYDSADPLFSTGGLYDPLKSHDRVQVASEAGLVNSVGVANVFIRGKLSTGPSYSLDLGPESSIGDLLWNFTQTGIQPGHHDTNFVWQFPDAEVPFWGGYFVPTEGTNQGEFYTYILNTGDYQLSSLNLSGNDKLLVMGWTRLYVTDELNLKGNAQIRILPSATLNLYVGAPTANLRGTGILNEGGPGHFRYYAVRANNTINLRLTTAFSGLIYAPRAVCYVTTKGGAAADVQGALVVQELDLGAPLRLHYDEALGR